jgi:exodeoxyribonuclease VII small subunit
MAENSVPDEKMTYEEAYTKLEEIVQQLERGNLALEESLNLFAEGQQLSAYCQQLLEQAELRVNQLVDGEITPLDD